MIRSAIESLTTESCTSNKLNCVQTGIIYTNDAVATLCSQVCKQFQQVEILIMKTILCIFVTVQCILLVSSVPTARHKRQLPCNHPLRLSLPQYFTDCDTAPCTYGSWSSWERIPGQNFSSVSQLLCDTGKAYTEERTRPTTGSGCDQPVRETRRICEHKTDN